MDDKASRAQRILSRLGYLALGYVAGELDDATRSALNRFQKLHDLALSSEPDDPTLAALEGADATGECILLGEVIDSAGPVSGVSINVRDRDLGPPDSWPILVPGVAFNTDELGRFEVRYSLNQVAPGDWAGRDKAYVPDLVFELSQLPVAHDGFDIFRLPATEPVSKVEQGLGIQARRLEEVRLVLNTASRRRQAGDSEFERLLADFSSIFDERSPESLDEAQQEVSFVARELTRPFDLVDALRLAFKISKSAFAQDVGAEVIYAIIRTRGITSVYGLATSTKDDLVAALKQAVADLIIGVIDDERIQQLAELILRLAPGKALEVDGSEGPAAKLQQVLQHVLPDTDEQTELIRRFGQNVGDTKAFWTSLAQVPAFAVDGKVQFIQFALQLDRLTGSNLPLMAALQQGGQGVKSTRQLLELGEQGLLDLMNQHEIAAPEGTAGTNALEQRKSHAADIIGALHLALPTESVAKILSDAPHLIDSDEAVSSAVRQFLSVATSDERRDADTAYDIRTTRLSQYLEQHGAAAFAGVDSNTQEKAVPHLQRAQRLFKLSTGPESFKALFASSLGSAHAIAQVPRLVFVAQWGEQVGKLDAMMIHARAQSTSASALQVYVALRDALSGVQPRALDLINAETPTPTTQVINAKVREAAAPLLKVIPNWESLFGPQELCDCKHCRSVLSPAAYLVDLLHFLEGPALDVLIGSKTRLGRRPDIAQLKLSCENTNTSLPYVDLVNEVLEGLALAYANASLAVDAPIFVNQTIPARDTGDATTAELQANPQYSIAAAYTPAKPTARKAIDAAVFPPSLPYSQPLATARVYLKHLGLPLADLIEGLSPTPASTDGLPWLAEALQLAPDETEVLTGSVNVDELYGLTPELLPPLKKGDSGLWVAALKRLMNIEGAGLTLALRAADEAFDDSCLAAVKAYQTAHGMVITGEVKHLAWETLLTLTPPLRSMVLPAPRELTRRLGIDYEELTALLQLPSINPAISAFRAITKTLALPQDDLLAFIAAGFTAPSVALLQALAAGGATEASFATWASEHFAGANWEAFLSTALLEVNQTDPCNLDLVRLRRWEEAKPDLDDAFWLRLASFLRLSRRLGWPFAELDAVLRSLQAPELTKDVLEQLAQINKLKARLQLSIPELVELWAAPDVTTSGSPYAKRFLSRAALRNDPAFAPDWKEQVLAEADRPGVELVTIAAHTPALLAGFRLTAHELTDIVTDAGLTPDSPLTLDVLGKITPRALLARALGIRPAELATLSTLVWQSATPTDLFKPPTREWALLKFVKAFDQLSKLNLSVAELGGIYLHSGPSVSAIAEQFAAVLPHLEDGFAQIKADTASAALETAFAAVPTIDPLLTALGFLIDDGITAQAILAAIDGTAIADVPLQTLLNRLEALGQLPAASRADAVAELWTTPSRGADGKPEPTAVKAKRAYLAALLEPVVPLARKRAVVKTVLSAALKLPADVAAALLEPMPGSTSALLHSVPKASAPMTDDFTEVANFADAAKAPLKPADVPHAVAAFTRLHKASTLIIASDLTRDDLLAVHGRWVNFNTLPVASSTDTTPFGDVLRLAAWAKFKSGWRPSKPAPTAVLMASSLASAADALALGAGSTSADILALAGALGWSLADVQSPEKLLELTRALDGVKRLGVSAATAIDWAKGPITPDLADQIKRTVKAKYNDEAWLTIAPPLADAIRESSRAALVAYLLPRLHLQDSNQLYQSLLIDVETAPGALTSRVKQAISSVQLFIQRCLLNLEPDVPASFIDRTQWEWMQRYRVWEANRKVFLNPHAYLRPELRDDKTPFFKELESELLQGELTNEACERALGHYLEKLHTVAKLEIGGMCIQNDFQPDELNKEVVHLFGRTANVPNKWFYRRLEVSRNDVKTWTPWETVPLDIQGDRVAPAIWNRRLHLFWPMVNRKAYGDGSPFDEVQIAWSEWTDKKWTAKKISPTGEAVNINFRLDTGRQLYVGDSIWRGEEGIPWLNGKLKVPVSSALLDAMRPVGDPADARQTPASADDRVAAKPTVGSNAIAAEDQFIAAGDLALELTQSGNLKGAYGFKLAASDQKTSHTWSGQGFSHDANFSFRNCHDTVHLYKWDWRQIKNGFALLQEGTALAIRDLSIKGATQQSVLRFGVERITEPFYAHQAHSYFTVQGGARSLLGTLNQGAGYVLRSLNKPSELKALLSPNASAGPTNAGTESAGTTPSASPLQTGFSEAKLGNAWLGATTQLAIAAMDSAAQTTNIVKVSALNIVHKLNDSPQIVFESLAHPYVCRFGEALARYGLPGLMNPEIQRSQPSPLFALPPYDTQVVQEPFPDDQVDFGLAKSSMAIGSTSFSAYNWELFFHIPTLLADRLLQSNHFEDALRMLRYVFDPTGGKGGYWKFKPFASLGSSVRLDNVKSLLAAIQEATSDGLKQLADWRDHPFQPHLLARHRIGEYMKFVVLKMIDICVKAGDYYFRQDTIESIEIARLYYVMAADLQGPRAIKVPAPGQTSAKSFFELREAGLDDFGNALVAFENEVPFYNSASTSALEEGSTVLGMSRSGYFGTPQDETLLAQWDLVEDRLFKIRHSMNIDGITRQLPLFEPPIDPMLLVQAAARGIDINSVINDLSTPMPAYRFSYMLQRALEMCNEVKGFGSALLSALEKKDGEQLALIRSAHEIDMLRLIREVKNKQVNELEAQKKVNETMLANAMLAKSHYAKLIGDKLISEESLHLSYLDEANEWQAQAGIADTLASYLHLFPQIAIKPSPPVVPEISLGGMQLGTYMNTIARFFSFMGGQASYQANKMSISGGHVRREQEWKYLLDRSSLEIKQQEQQQAALAIRIDIANLEVMNHDKQIANATEIDDFLRRQKYTNQELYVWMESKISEVYYQSYQLAYELAKKAERAYRFELALTNSDFIKFGSWDSQRKGLMAGEQLALQLRQMERAYHEGNKREYEITKHVSLLSLDPMALIRLKEVGAAEFALPEALFDMDFAGHYMRRIKSVSITLPCVTGPYASVSATLRLMKSRIRYKPETAVGYAPREDDTRFLTNYAATRAVATSTGQNDAGLFELNFRDERYLPFEGEGVESLWRLEINKDYASFDIHTLSDAVLHIRYTAREGGETLKSAAKMHLTEALKSTFTSLDGKPQPLTRLFSVRHEFPEAWNELTQPVPADSQRDVTRELTLPITKDRFPFFTLGRKVLPTRVTVLIAPKPDAKVPNLEVTVQDKPLSDAGTSSEATAARVVHRVWSAEGPFAQVSQDEISAWNLRLTLDASALRSIVQRLEELVIAVEYTAAI